MRTLTALLLFASIAAAHPWPWSVGPWCVDDYDRKCEPRPPCPLRPGCCDDYDAKPLPTACPARCFGCNDYDRKSPPCVEPCFPGWYRCVPLGDGCRPR